MSFKLNVKLDNTVGFMVILYTSQKLKTCPMLIFYIRKKDIVLF